jgi:predicted phage terminase large subunit-like protein
MTTATFDIMELDEAELMSSIVSESLYEFVREFWDVVCAEKPVWNWHIPYLCSELETVARRTYLHKPKEYDLVVNISPGSTKSILVSIMFPAWVWSWFPSAGFIGSSYTYDLAVRMSRLNRAIVKSERYQEAFPKTKIIADQDAKGYFVNVSKGERMCAGIDGDIIGRHADFILVDDPLKPKGARSEAELESANVFINETLSSRKKDKAVTPTILIMQRLHQNDPTGMLLEEFPDGIRHICLPAEVSRKVKPSSLAKNYRRGLMDPVRLSRQVLEQERKRGDFYFSGQFMQDPVPIGGAMFKTERIVIEDMPPRRMTKVVRYWDNAGTKEAGAHTVGAKLGKNCDGRFWILDIVRGRWEAAAREAKKKQVAETDTKTVIIGQEQEPGSSGKDVAEATARNLAGWRIRLVRPTGDKAERADPFAAQVNSGNVSMVKGPWNREYLNELAFFPLSTYKDQVDASSGAFNMLSKPEPFVGIIGVG